MSKHQRERKELAKRLAERTETLCEQRWYFTFGLAHPLRDRFVVLEGDVESTRQLMLFLFGPDWSTQYTERGWHSTRRARNGIVRSPAEAYGGARLPLPDAVIEAAEDAITGRSFLWTDLSRVFGRAVS